MYDGERSRKVICLSCPLPSDAALFSHESFFALGDEEEQEKVGRVRDIEDTDVAEKL